MRLISKGHLEIHLSKEVPDELPTPILPHASILYGINNSGQYLFQKLSAPAYTACIANIFSVEKDTLVLLKDQTCYWLQIQLEGTFTCHAEQIGDISMREWSMNLFYSRSLYFEIHLSANSNYTSFALSIPAYLIESFARQYSIVEALENRSKTGKPQRLSKANLICNFEIIDLIYNVQKKGLAILTPEAITSLLTKVFEKASSPTSPELNIDDKTIKKIYSLKKFLTQNLQEDYPRSILMKQFHLSLHHFTSVFAKIYGVPPFKLLKFFRMLEVRSILESNPSLALKEIAYTFKYSSPDALLHAYKDIYGHYPSIDKPKHQYKRKKKNRKAK